MSSRYLRENLTFSDANVVVESVQSDQGKSFYMRGIFIQGDVRNANERIYPTREIEHAVGQLNEQIKSGNSVLGEVDHPDDLKINLDRVSHMIQEMWVDGSNGFGKLKILPTPMGDVIAKMLGAGVKLGVSSRGSGNVDDMSGKVSDFEIVTVDIVAQPSAPNAYPKAIYEGLINMTNGHRVIENLKDYRYGATTPAQDRAVQKYLSETVVKMIKDLKLK